MSVDTSNPIVLVLVVLLILALVVYLIRHLR